MKGYDEKTFGKLPGQSPEQEPPAGTESENYLDRFAEKHGHKLGRLARSLRSVAVGVIIIGMGLKNGDNSALIALGLLAVGLGLLEMLYHLKKK